MPITICEVLHAHFHHRSRLQRRADSGWFPGGNVRRCRPFRRPRLGTRADRMRQQLHRPHGGNRTRRRGNCRVRIDQPNRPRPQHRRCGRHRRLADFHRCRFLSIYQTYSSFMESSRKRIEASMAPPGKRNAATWPLPRIQKISWATPCAFSAASISRR